MLENTLLNIQLCERAVRRPINRAKPLLELYAVVVWARGGWTVGVGVGKSVWSPRVPHAGDVQMAETSLYASQSVTGTSYTASVSLCYMVLEFYCTTPDS